MAIQFGCENCRQPIEVDDEAAGRQAQCPYCRAIVQVPAFSDATISGIASPTRQQATLQTALPVPHRQGAPRTIGPDRSRPDGPHSATLGFMALSTVIIAGVLFIVFAVTMFLATSEVINPAGPIPKMDRVIEVQTEIVESKPWLGIVLLFVRLLGFTSVGLAIASFMRRERPRWPAMAVMAVFGAMLCMTLGSGLIFMSLS